MVAKVTLGCLVATCILAVLILAYTGFRAVKNKNAGALKSVGQRVAAGFMAVLMIALVGVNGAVYYFNNVIGLFMAGSSTDTPEGVAARELAFDVTRQIEEEGIVLLENKNSALPLDVSNEREQKLNIFGVASYNFIFNGSGSGSSQVDMTTFVTLQQGLENAGFDVNDDLTEFYSQYSNAESGGRSTDINYTDFDCLEPEVSAYSQELLDGAKAFSDTALVVFARSGGEGNDLPLEMEGYNGGTPGRHYLELQEKEEAMLEMVESMGFEKIIVIVDSSHAMELGFLEHEAIDGALLIGGPGQTGCDAVGKVLAGTVNPSGHTVDTYPYDATSAPSYYNFGAFMLEGTNNYLIDYHGGQRGYEAMMNDGYYVNYAEGIYVGYRYYETAAEDGYIDFDSVVQYPFGYGLSYTSFIQEITDLRDDGDTITVDVTVTNTGSAAGKDVVEIYYSAPYYTNGIEKAAVNLAGFGKTELLAPGASDTVTITFTYEDMASYDYQGVKAVGGAYVLEAGDYAIKLMKDSHTLIDSRTVTVDSDVIYNESNDGARSTDLTIATNQFDWAAGDVKYVSRADWEGTMPTQRASDRPVTDEEFAALTDTSVATNDSDVAIVVQDHSLKLADMVGVAYDDPQWDTFVEQLTVNEMANLMANGGYATIELESVGKPATVDLDGPVGVNGLVNGASGAQYTSGVSLAQTWNLELAALFGDTFGAEADAYGVSGLYAPGCDTHRSPFLGRNFEYYSEDGLLSGKFTSAIVQNLWKHGVYGYVKHFALNEMETHRWSLVTYSNEQAIREIYLKPFEIAVKEGSANAIMSSYNRIGTRWTGSCYELLTTVLRGEWGFEGMVISDWVTPFGYQNPDMALAAGNDMMLNTVGVLPSSVTTETNTGNQRLRESAKNILYTVANSNVFTAADKQPTPYWLLLLVGLDVLVLGVSAFVLYRVTGKKKS